VAGTVQLPRHTQVGQRVSRQPAAPQPQTCQLGLRCCSITLVCTICIQLAHHTGPPAHQAPCYKRQHTASTQSTPVPRTWPAAVPPGLAPQTAAQQQLTISTQTTKCAPVSHCCDSSRAHLACSSAATCLYCPANAPCSKRHKTVSTQKKLPLSASDMGFS
jgi:hypothetical protein